MPESSSDFLVMFDIDGVLVDSRANLLDSYVKTCNEFHLSADPKRFLALIGKELGAIFSQLHGISSAKLINFFRQESARDISKLRPFPGARELISYLMSHDYPLCCVTSKDEERARSALAACGYPELAIFSPSKGLAPKPEPDLILSALRHFNAAKGVYLGDTVWDAMSSEAAKIPFVFCGWGFGDNAPYPFVAETAGEAGELIIQLRQC